MHKRVAKAEAIISLLNDFNDTQIEFAPLRPESRLLDSHQHAGKDKVGSQILDLHVGLIPWVLVKSRLGLRFFQLNDR